jgi:type IV secretory pathway VirB10-like protein
MANDQPTSTRTRTLLIIVGIMVIIGVIVAIYSFSKGKKPNKMASPTSSVPNNIYVTPGAKSSEKYAKLQAEANIAGTKKAEAQGKTFVPTILGNKSEDDGRNFNDQLTNILKVKEKVTDNSELDRLNKQLALLLAELNKHGNSIDDLLKLIQELQNKGYNVSDLENLLKKLMNEGYNTEELAKLLNKLKSQDYKINDLEAMLRRLLKEGHDPELINKILEQLLKDKLKALEDALKKLQDGGYDTKNLKNLEQQLNNPDITKLLEQLANQGYKVDSLDNLLKQLMDKGYNIFDWQIMFTQLKQDGYQVDKLQELLNNLKANGVEINDLKNLFDAISKQNTPKNQAAANLNSKTFLQEQLQNVFANKEPPPTNNPSVASLDKEYAELIKKQQEAAIAEERARKLEAERIRKNKQLALTAEAKQKAMNEILANMNRESETANTTWNTVPQQSFIQGELSAAKLKENDINQNNNSNNATSNNNLMQFKSENNDTIIKAGTILFAVLETSVNSDEPGPILARIVQPPLKNTKLIGTVQASTNKHSETLTLNFSTANIPERIKTYGISAVAIDPNTARTALASNVDHHYLLRWGTIFAATFLQGYSRAVAQSGTTVQSSNNGAQTNTVTTQAPLNPKQQTFQGLGDMASSWGQGVSQFSNRPITITINAGISVGILFTSDFTIPSTDEAPAEEVKQLSNKPSAQPDNSANTTKQEPAVASTNQTNNNNNK